MKLKRLGNNRELWTNEIRTLIPTSEQWLAKTAKKRLGIEVAGIGLYKIAGILGIQGQSPVNNNADYIVLGAAVYGEHDPNIAPLLPSARRRIVTRDTLGKDVKKWREAIRRQVPAFQQWAEMDLNERRKFKIGERGLVAIASIFGI